MAANSNSNNLAGNLKMSASASSEKESGKKPPEANLANFLADEEDLDVDLDLDPMINECTHLTSHQNSTTLSQQSSSRPKSSSPSQHCQAVLRSPSRNLMLAIGGMLSSGSSSGKISPSGSKAISGNNSSSDEIQILIDSPKTKNALSSNGKYHRQLSSDSESFSTTDTSSNSSSSNSSSSSSSSNSSSPLTSLTLSSAASNYSNSSTLPASITSSTVGLVAAAVPVARSQSHRTTPKPSTTTIVAQDTLLLPASVTRNYQRYHDRRHSHHHSVNQNTNNNNNPNNSHRSSRQGQSTEQSSRDRSRPSRIASCISVQSVASIASTDSSLSDYPPNTPICKFCHQRARQNDPLISPCYCKGTIRYMHCRCLMKWLDKLKKRNSRHQPLACEICNYEYRWKKRFKPTGEWQLPPCIGNDRQWHTVFVICAFLMVVSMVNLIIFGEEDSHNGRGGHPGGHLATHNNYPAMRFAPPAASVLNHANHNANHPNSVFGSNGAGGATSGPDPTQLSHEKSNPIATLTLKDLFLNAKDNSVTVNDTGTGGGGGGPGSAPFFLFNPSNQQNNLSSASININNVTELLKTVSNAFPALRNMLPGVKVKNGTTKDSGGAKTTTTASLDTLDALLQERFGKVPSQTKGTIAPTDSPGAPSDHFLYHPHNRSPHHRSHRKNSPTRPSEVILVISGCLFFISFFLGTFAQIKSEVSFYTMICRFVHWNQQWIIEEYDPDGGLNGSSDAGVVTPTGDTGSTIYGEEVGHPEGLSNEASTSSITKEDAARSGSQICVQIEPTSNGTSYSELSLPSGPSPLPPPLQPHHFQPGSATTSNTNMIITTAPISHTQQVIDL